MVGGKDTPRAEASGPRIAAREVFARNIVLVDGPWRSGKTLLCQLISSLERAEMWQMYAWMSQYPQLFALGLMREDVAVALLRDAVDRHVFYGQIGRFVNCRYGDNSSIWRFRDPRIYLERLLADVSEQDVMDGIDALDAIHPIMSHDALQSIELFLTAFGDLKLVRVKRHPVPLAMDWRDAGWGHRIGSDPRAFWLTLDTPEGPTPPHALGWEKEYLGMCPMDRIIRGIKLSQEGASAEYNRLSDDVRQRILFTSFEWMATEPDALIDQLSRFLGTVPSSQTPQIMARERVPRTLTRADHEAQLRTICEEATPEAFDLLVAMSETYEREIREEFDIEIRALLV